MQQAADQQANALLWAPANFLLLDPLRMTFGPGSSLLDRGLGTFLLLPFVGVVGHGIGLDAAAARRLTTVSDAARAAEESAGVASSLATNEGGAAPARDAAPFVEFAHGTTRELGLNIIDKGINYEDSINAMLWSKEPGSLFTVRVDPSDPREALSAAASWGLDTAAPLVS